MSNNTTRASFWVVTAVAFSNMTGIAAAASISPATAGFSSMTEKALALTIVAQRQSHFVTPRNRNMSGSSGSSVQSNTSGWYPHDRNVLALGSPEWWRERENDHGCGQ